MIILICNVGSTSLKAKLYKMPEEEALCEFRIERLGSESSNYTYKRSFDGTSIPGTLVDKTDYASAVRCFLSYATGETTGVLASADEVDRVGFKTVLAKDFYGVHQLNQAVLKGMEDMLSVAPVHNSAYLESIVQIQEIMPGKPLIGAFETAFHQTIPLKNRIYSVPYEWYEKFGLMRMGYHGASHGYIAQQSKQYGKNQRVISCHLGGSSSICAIADGKSIDNSFGFSLQSGVLHANRCGDVDPLMIPYIESCGLSRDEVIHAMHTNGGLKGISGLSGDVRDLEEAIAQGNERAELAIDAFVCSIVRYIGAYIAELGGLDQLTFTGGIGENSVLVREKVCAHLQYMGLTLDPAKNVANNVGVLSTDDSAVCVTMIPANEEIGIARQVYTYTVE